MCCDDSARIVALYGQMRIDIAFFARLCYIFIYKHGQCPFCWLRARLAGCWSGSTFMWWCKIFAFSVLRRVAGLELCYNLYTSS